MNKKILEVSALENGTVIDHIPSANLYKVMHLLNLETVTSKITFGNNLDSKRIGKKAIIKISDLKVNKNKLHSLVIFAPEARVSYIEDYEVAEKIKLQLPDIISGYIKCANPMCVTNIENVKSRFVIIDKMNIALSCCYCEKTTKENELELAENIY